MVFFAERSAELYEDDWNIDCTDIDATQRRGSQRHRAKGWIKIETVRTQTDVKVLKHTTFGSLQRLDVFVLVQVSPAAIALPNNPHSTKKSPYVKVKSLHFPKIPFYTKIKTCVGQQQKAAKIIPAENIKTKATQAKANEGAMAKSTVVQIKGMSSVKNRKRVTAECSSGSNSKRRRQTEPDPEASTTYVPEVPIDFLQKSCDAMQKACLTEYEEKSGRQLDRRSMAQPFKLANYQKRLWVDRYLAARRRNQDVDYAVLATKTQFKAFKGNPQELQAHHKFLLKELYAGSKERKGERGVDERYARKAVGIDTENVEQYQGRIETGIAGKQDSFGSRGCSRGGKTEDEERV